MPSLSVRKEAEARQELKKSIEILKKARKSIEDKLNNGDTLRDQDLRFLEHYPDILRQLREKQIETKEEDLPEGTLKKLTDNLHRINELLKANGYPIGKEGLEKLFEKHSYYFCGLCGYTHKNGEECPIKLLNKKGEENEMDKRED